MCIAQGRHEVSWRLRQETSLPSPCSDLRSFGSKCFEIYCFEKRACDIVGTFWLPAVIRRPGSCDSLPPSLRLWCYAIKIRKFSEINQIFKSECHEHLQFSNTIRHRSCTDWQQILLGAFQVSSCSLVPLLCLPHEFFRRGPVFLLLIMKLLRHSTSYIFKVR